jgi:hypothetical protein
MALIADRDSDLHLVSMQDLAEARGSTYKPFPPRNTWYTFDFAQPRTPRADDIRAAIDDVCATMLEGPISNIGVRGIRKTAERVGRWSQMMDQEELKWACFNTYIFIDASGGTGGGIFRYMYGRFLKEAAVLLENGELDIIGSECMKIGDQWQQLAEIFKRGASSEDPAKILPQTIQPLLEIAEREESLWGRLQLIAKM